MSEIDNISPNHARELTDRIKVAVEATWELVKEAYVSRAWAALGYSSWDDYCTREFGTARIRLPREERQEVVSSMREIGMSTRAIGAATGISYKTVQRELAGGTNVPPESGPVVGTDGKTYTPKPAATNIPQYDLDELNTTPTREVDKPTPPPVKSESQQKPEGRKRSPITEQANRVGWDIRKAGEKLEDLLQDDRFDKNSEQLTPLLRGHIKYFMEVSEETLERLEEG